MGMAINCRPLGLLCVSLQSMTLPRKASMKNRIIASVTRFRVLVFCVSLLLVTCVSLVGASISVYADRSAHETQQPTQQLTHQTAPQTGSATPPVATQSTPAENT